MQRHGGVVLSVDLLDYFGHLNAVGVPGRLVPAIGKLMTQTLKDALISGVNIYFYQQVGAWNLPIQKSRRSEPARHLEISIPSLFNQRRADLMKWPFKRREERTAGYTSLIVAGLEATAAADAGNVLRTGALEIAAGLWGRTLAAANIEGAPEVLTRSGASHHRPRSDPAR